MIDHNERLFSVIIPTHNRHKELASCLQCLVEMNFPRDQFEVIVVDDGSAILPEDVVRSFEKQLDVMLITQPNAGPAAARNAGAEKAKGRYLAFTDDDCRPAEGWLSAFAAILPNAPHCAAGGRTINALSENSYSAASQKIIDFVSSRMDTSSIRAKFFASNNLALSAELFKTMNGFDTSLRTSEDRDFCSRWLHSGYQMIPAPDALVYHAHVLNFRSFWRQHLHYGYGAFHFRKKLASREKKPVALESGRFYLGLFLYPLSQNHNWRGFLLSSLLVISQIASAIGFLSEWIRSRSRTENS